MDQKLLRAMRLGGVRDAAGLSALGLSSLMATSSLSAAPIWAQGLLAASGGFQMADRLLSPYLARQGIIGESAIDYAPEGFMDALKGLNLGYAMKDGRPLQVPEHLIPYHQTVVGRSGGGKTVYLFWLILQQLLRGGGLLMVDAKLDIKTLYELNSLLKWAGRENDLIVLNPGDWSMSNSYNPLLFGDPDEVAQRPLSLIPSTENDPGADHYKQEANQGLTTLVMALQRAGLAFNFMDLSILMNSARALDYLVSQVPESDEKTNLLLWLEKFRRGKVIDVGKLKDTFGGIGGRMFMFGSGGFGKITSSYNPDLVLFDAIRQNKIIYVMLPILAKSVAATNFAKMLVADLRTAAAWVQSKLPDEEKPNPVFLGLLDEAGAYTSMDWSRAYEQFRSARISLISAMQTFANLDAVSPELTEMVLGNSFSKVFFGLGSQDTADRAAELIGKYYGVTRTMAEAGSRSESMNILRTSPEQTMGETASSTYSEREQEMHRVSPDLLKGLGLGEAIVNMGGKDTIHLKVPLFNFGRDLKKAGRDIKINSFFRREKRGIALFERASDFISSEDISEMTKRAKDDDGGARQGPKKSWVNMG